MPNIKTKNIPMFMLCQKNKDGSLGTPLGVTFGEEDDTGMVLFDDQAMAKLVQDKTISQLGVLGLFRVNVVVVGEVLA